VAREKHSGGIPSDSGVPDLPFGNGDHAPKTVSRNATLINIPARD
jgi:hypothetical protein